MPEVGPRTVVVTGVGAVTPVGIGAFASFDGLFHSEPAVILADGPDGTVFQGRVRQFAAQEMLDDRSVRENERWVVLGLVAAKEAVACAGDVPLDNERTMVSVGTSFGGVVGMVGAKERRVSPKFVPQVIPSALATRLAIHYGVIGPCMTYLGACAAGAQAVGEGMQAIQEGRVDTVLAGGADSLFVSAIVSSLYAAGAVARGDHSYRGPFDRGRSGMALAEGAGFLVLERYETAKARGAEMLATITGYGCGNDAHHVTAPDPNGAGAERVMRMALSQAHLGAKDIAWVNAHATGTRIGDVAELRALDRVFDATGRVDVTSLKGVMGHSLGASGAIEAVMSVLALQRGSIPGTVALGEPESAANLHLLADPVKDWEPGPILSNSFGFGGHNASLVIEPVR